MDRGPPQSAEARPQLTITATTTVQEIYSAAWEHFITRHSPPSVDANGVCRYRLDGTASCPVRCAAGIFIPDEKYVPMLEGVSVQPAPFDKEASVCAAIGIARNDPRVTALRVLQNIHDMAARTANMLDGNNHDFHATFQQRLSTHMLREGLEIPNH